ncbi:uncharacterized protein C16orf95 homolog [Sorex fumeus]|uniref:uncharacterized protein C16orf95 homolog n=1 Tax=Sorex fumeus TaxID=62283 RepID=UPI0024AE3821|nr:uncharacterized protein C16orf95 homolog [Sorex fumeus]
MKPVALPGRSERRRGGAARAPRTAPAPPRTSLRVPAGPGAESGRRRAALKADLARPRRGTPPPRAGPARRDPGPGERRPLRGKRKGQTPGKDPSPEAPLVCPDPSSAERRAVGCGCPSGFGGRLPVPRAEVALPYWVPVSLRPRQQVWKVAGACSCPRRHFGGRFPAPRDQAVLPYWVPSVLRFPRKVPSGAAGAQGRPGDARPDACLAPSCPRPADGPPDAWPCCNRWRTRCDPRLLLKGRKLRSLQAPGWAPLLPLSLSLLTLLQALLRVVLAVRHFFWV